MELGVRECLNFPLVQADVRAVIERTRTRCTPDVRPETDHLYSFLPARPGVGASVLAVQAALNLPTDPKHRGFLMDVDLEASLIQFMLKVQNPHSLIHALEFYDELDEHRWSQLLTNREHLDILQSGSATDYQPDLRSLQSVLAFARKQYSAILVDLPSVINRLTTEVIEQSNMVFLVTTPDAASLHMLKYLYIN